MSAPATKRLFGGLSVGARARSNKASRVPTQMERGAEAPRRRTREALQSACLRRKAGISISSMPLLASASTLAAAVRPLRQTLGVFSPS